MPSSQLKHDALGTLRLLEIDGVPIVERDTRTARAGVRWLARWLARREATTLAALTGVAHVPRLLSFDGHVVHRSHLPGAAMHLERPSSRHYFVRALRVLRALHRAGIAHNDLAKEANWIVGPGDEAGIVDFQIATRSPRRGWRFRRLAREDLRHLLKHKRTFCPDSLTDRQLRLLAAPSTAARSWRALWKPVYRLVTRGLLRWPERRGAHERGT